MVLNQLKTVSKKRKQVSNKTVKCRKKCSKKNTACIKKQCDKVDRQLWKLNWTYNKLLAKLKSEVIKVAIEHGKVDKALYIKTKDMFLDNPEESFYELFVDVKSNTAKEQLKKKLATTENAIKTFETYEKKAK